MTKKLLSAILAGSIVASVAAVSAVSASAIVASDGTYQAGDGITTKRVYLAMPDEWSVDTSILPSDWQGIYGTSAGIYWWGGTDTAGDNAQSFYNKHEWPAYKMVQDESVENLNGVTLWYADIPEDVPTVVFNNYLDGGMDETQAYYTEAKQCVDSACEYIAEGDYDLYDLQNNEEFWNEMTEAWENGDESVFGDYLSNVTDCVDLYDEVGFTLDNMIWVVDQNNVSENPVSHRLVYDGNWYFNYGDGTYGTYPTKEAALEKGFVGDLTAEPATPDEPSTTTPSSTDPASTTATDASSDATAPTPGQDATSSTGNSATADSTTKTTSSSGTVQTGAASLAVIAFVVIAGAGSVVFFSRKRKSN